MTYHGRIRNVFALDRGPLLAEDLQWASRVVNLDPDFLPGECRIAPSWIAGTPSGPAHLWGGPCCRRVPWHLFDYGSTGRVWPPAAPRVLALWRALSWHYLGLSTSEGPIATGEAYPFTTNTVFETSSQVLRAAMPDFTMSWANDVRKR